MTNRIPPKHSLLRPIGVSAFLGSALVGLPQHTHAQSTESGNTVRMERLEKENMDLKHRLDSLEQMMQKEGINAPKGGSSVKALSSVEVSGFATASYFYDTSTPGDRKSNGYLWNTSHDSFELNKVKLTIASPPVERSGDKWDAGYRASLIWGEDARFVNTGGETQGFEALREAYVEVNAPIGSGLDIKAGQLISLLNYESGDGGAANPNFSQGFQWWYTGNGPSAGVQLGYTFTDWLDVKARVQNGLFAGPIDNHAGKTFMGAIGLKPTQDLWFSLIGFGGEESATLDVAGGSLLAGYKVTKQFGTGLEFDYFNIDYAGPGDDVVSIGGWFTYDFTEKFGAALRAEYLHDRNGWIGGTPFPGTTAGGSGTILPNGIGGGIAPGGSIGSTDASGDLSSITLTLNFKPVPNVKIQPEIRYDHTGYKNGFDGEESRVIVGAGISYLF